MGARASGEGGRRVGRLSGERGKYAGILKLPVFELSMLDFVVVVVVTPGLVAFIELIKGVCLFLFLELLNDITLVSLVLRRRQFCGCFGKVCRASSARNFSTVRVFPVTLMVKKEEEKKLD